MEGSSLVSVQQGRHGDLEPGGALDELAAERPAKLASRASIGYFRVRKETTDLRRTP